MKEHFISTVSLGESMTLLVILLCVKSMNVSILTMRRMRDNISKITYITPLNPYSFLPLKTVPSQTSSTDI